MTGSIIASTSENGSTEIDITITEYSSKTDQSCDQIVETYIKNCRYYDIKIDPSVVIALKTGWSILKPTNNFTEGALLPLMEILKTNKHVKKINFASSALYDSRYRSYENGNSNARVLKYILKENHMIKDVDLSYTGLGDDGIREVSEGIKVNKSIESINLSYNNFGEDGAEKLKDALLVNQSLLYVDLSYNALGFRSIDNLVRSCKYKRHAMVIHTNGNYVLEEILNSVSHGVCFLVSIVGSSQLITAAANEKTYTPENFWSCVLYSFSLIFLFLSSCLFHSFFMLPQASRILQILDHVGISFLIAGSYTPFLLIGQTHVVTRFLCVAEWVGALFATGFAALSDLNSPTTTTVELSVFCLMGVGPIFFWHITTSSLSIGATQLYIGGGVAYLVGIPFFILGEVNPSFHVVWHLFVAVGATIHWFLIYIYILNADVSSVSEQISDVISIFQNVSHF